MEKPILVNVYEVRHEYKNSRNIAVQTDVVARDISDIEIHFAPLNVISCILLKKDVLLTTSAAYSIHGLVEQDITMEVQKSKDRRK